MDLLTIPTDGHAIVIVTYAQYQYARSAYMLSTNADPTELRQRLREWRMASLAWTMIFPLNAVLNALKRGEHIVPEKPYQLSQDDVELISQVPIADLI